MNIKRLVGRYITPSRFKVRTSLRYLYSEDLMPVLNGSCPACIVKDALSPADAERLAEAYLTHQAKRRDDGVPAHELGIGGYGLTPEAYFDKVSQTRAEMDSLYASAGLHLPSAFSELLQPALDPGIVYRSARHRGQTAAAFRAIHFADQGPLALKPHEDRSQTGAYEYADCLVVCGANFYPRTPPDAEGGVLRIWNIAPSETIKELLGVQKTGYPYPIELLKDIEYVDIRPQTGDMIIFSADMVHAVTAWRGAADERVVFQSFIGLSPRGQLLHWT